MMPVYQHRCECGEEVTEFRKIADFDQDPTCPRCKVPMPQVFDGSIAVRANYKQPILLQSVGFIADPEDVAEHRRRFPNVELEMHQGSAIPKMRSLGQKRKYLKAIGWVDKNSFSG